MYLGLNSNSNHSLNNYETKSYLPLVKELQFFEYKWANLNSYSWRSCGVRILINLWDFLQKVWTPLKFKKDSNWILILNFIIQNLKRFGSWAKKIFVQFECICNLAKFGNFWRYWRLHFVFLKFIFGNHLEKIIWNMQAVKQGLAEVNSRMA
jgi:hypothetical protein